jgi:hypothetical protein
VGFDQDRMRLSVQALANAWPPYLEVTWHGGGEGIIDGVTERTRRELGTWPTSASVVDELVGALQKAADAETEPERKSRLRAIAEGLSGLPAKWLSARWTNKLNGL